MKLIKRFWREGACILLVSLFLQFIMWFAVKAADTSFKRFLLSAATVADVVALFYLVRELWRKKWKRAFSDAARRLIVRTSRFVIRLLEKWNIGKKKGGKVLGGHTVITFDGAEIERASKKTRRRKWKHMQNERERLGFLYGRMINERVKNGMRATPHDTPLELERLWENNETEQKLFDLYIDTRYDERKAISETDIEHLRGAMGVK